MWWKISVVTTVALAGAIAAGFLYGRSQWQSHTEARQTALLAASVPMGPGTYDPHELEGLPDPVQRYFATVLTEGQPIIAAVQVDHAGTFNMGEQRDQWRPFQSSQYVITQRPGFLWNAAIEMAPGLSINVHDAYIDGAGILTAKLFGFITVMEQPRTPELDHGELMRFFAEAAWYPTALLPSQGVLWEPIAYDQARATMTDGDTTVTLVFHFNEYGLISTVRADARYREVNGIQVATPWQGQFWNYQVRHCMLVPLEGEVAWLLPDGPKAYWRGRVQRIAYRNAGAATAQRRPVPRPHIFFNSDLCRGRVLRWHGPGGMGEQVD